MANRRTVNDVINPGYNPGSTVGPVPNFQNQLASFILNDNQAINNDNRNLNDLLAENQRLKMAIAQWKNKKPVFQE